jgi:hypothetical protein
MAKPFSAISHPKRIDLFVHIIRDLKDVTQPVTVRSQDSHVTPKI